jgi:4-amino-4-deoxychorismate lyase
MCQFIETIAYENGQFQRLGLHNERCNRTRKHFFGTLPPIEFESVLSIPEHLKHETVKCKVTYAKEIIHIDYDLYTIRAVHSLRLVVDDTIEYAFKYADRSKLNALFQMRGQYDDILIVKNGLITDTSYANIVFKKDGNWYSPQNPLLQGTRLASYLRNGRIISALLHPDDLHLYSEARIINSMISIESSPIVPIENIHF